MLYSSHVGGKLATRFGQALLVYLLDLCVLMPPPPLAHRFSKVAVVRRHHTGWWCLSMRVANLRKHQILQPHIRMVVTAVDSITPSNYMSVRAGGGGTDGGSRRQNVLL